MALMLFRLVAASSLVAAGEASINKCFFVSLKSLFSDQFNFVTRQFNFWIIDIFESTVFFKLLFIIFVTQILYLFRNMYLEFINIMFDMCFIIHVRWVFIISEILFIL